MSVLGTSKNVPDALANLRKVQIVKNSLQMPNPKKVYFGGNPVHVVIRDKDGNSAVLEWTAVKGRPTMHTYVHKAGPKTTPAGLKIANEINDAPTPGKMHVHVQMK